MLHVFQAKLLCCMEESGLAHAAFKELRSAINLALRATKMMAQAIGRSMTSLMELEHHLWLTLTEIKVPFLHSTISPTGLFGRLKLRGDRAFSIAGPNLWRFSTAWYGTVRYGTVHFWGVFHWVLYLVPDTFLVPLRSRFQVSRTITKT